MEEQGKESLSQPKPMSARDHNNEFVYDVLDLVMNTHMNLAWIEPLRNLLTKWTTMKLPSAATIKRNHLPRYLELNPDVAEKRSEGKQSYPSETTDVNPEYRKVLILVN